MQEMRVEIHVDTSPDRQQAGSQPTCSTHALHTQLNRSTHSRHPTCSANAEHEPTQPSRSSHALHPQAPNLQCKRRARTYAANPQHPLAAPNPAPNLQRKRRARTCIAGSQAVPTPIPSIRAERASAIDV